MLNIFSEFAVTAALNFINKKSHLIKIGQLSGLKFPSLIFGGVNLNGLMK